MDGPGGDLDWAVIDQDLSDYGYTDCRSQPGEARRLCIARSRLAVAHRPSLVIIGRSEEYEGKDYSAEIGGDDLQLSMAYYESCRREPTTLTEGA